MTELHIIEMTSRIIIVFLSWILSKQHSLPLLFPSLHRIIEKSHYLPD